MADINYTVNQDIPENIEGFEQYSQEDKNLINSFQINSVFDPEKNYSELHILSLSDEILESDYLYNRYTQLGNAQSAGQGGASILTIDPIADSKYYGYDGGGIKLLYHFLDDLYTDDITTKEFFIQEISPDRTEVVLNSLNITQEQIVSYTANIKSKLDSQSYFAGFRLNFKENDLVIATNIDTIDSGTQKLVAVKLYEPLPEIYDLKSTLTVVEIISDSIAYEVDSEYVLQPEQLATLRSANFNIEITDESVIPTAYLSYDELFSYPVTNVNNEIYSTISEKGINVNVNYTDLSSFVHFSSAEERLLNFKYKVDLLSSYSASISSSQAATTGLQGVSGSKAYYENLITGVVNNFDHYERFLYYESGSSSWPKSNTTKPYTNKVSTTSEAITWFTAQRSQAIYYDQTNYNSLVNSIPTYLKDDTNNDNYLTFIYMIGQHFDNLWLYAKAVTDKYDADNRLDKGISKDLVGEALKNFGVKLYTSNKSIEDLFSTFTGQAYQSGSEVINYYITGSLTGSNTSIQPSSFDNYQKEIQKRIYHNLPLLLKSKGTERGLRALINCFGIPGDILDIKLYGGRNTTTMPNLGDSLYYTSSLDKVRLDNTGSILSGSTLSSYTSIVKRDDKYTDDIHTIEVGFSPTDAVDNYIIQSGSLLISSGIFATNFINRVLADGGTVESAQALLDSLILLESIGSPSISADASFNYSIDQFLGDPGNLYLDNYSGLDIWNKYVTQNLSRYDVQDYVRLIKFFDNTVFKMIKDFLPARSIADVGVVIKPHILNISKAKSVTVSGLRPEYTGSIDTAFISAKNASTFKAGEREWSTNYIDFVQTPTNFVQQRTQHFQEQAKYNGELSGSYVKVSDRDLNTDNPYKKTSYIVNTYEVNFVSASAEVCNLAALSTLTNPVYIDPTKTYKATDFFQGSDLRTTYSASNGAQTIPALPTYTGIPLASSYSFTGLNQYDYFYIKADNWDKSPSISCTDKTITARYGTCNLLANSKILGGTTVVQYTTGNDQSYPISTWFTVADVQRTSVQYTASWDSTIQGIPNTDINNYKFTQAPGTEVTITVNDPKLGVTCTAKQVVTVSNCELGTVSYDEFRFGMNQIEFEYSYWQDLTSIQA